MAIQDQPPESPRKGKLGWYCSYACWYDIEGPIIHFVDFEPHSDGWWGLECPNCLSGGHVINLDNESGYVNRSTQKAKCDQCNTEFAVCQSQTCWHAHNEDWGCGRLKETRDGYPPPNHPKPKKS